jgi:outer membrane protein insertion porin family
LRFVRSVLLVVLVQLAASAGYAQQSADRIYVRRIEFRGVTRTNDEVLRRELRQLEGTFLSPAAIEESRVHLERLPSVERATIAVAQVPGSDNVADVIVTITEEPTRRYGVGGGYASSLGTSVHGYFVNDNLFGSGQQLSMAMDVSELGSIAEASHTNPYAFDAGVSRTIGLTSRDVDKLTVDTSSIDAELLEGRLEYGWAIARQQSVRLGLALRRTSLDAGPDTSVQLTSWIAANGEPNVTDGAPSTELAELDLLFRWRYDSRNHDGFPDRGVEQSVDARVAFPASDVEYFNMRYDAARYWPVGRSWTASVRGVAGFGDSFGDTTGLPPYLNWFAGGPTTVRGYRELGPKDSLGNPYGGNLLVAAQLELKTPWPRRWAARMRSGFFLDVGNVYSTDGTAFFDAGGQLIDHGFSASELRASAGVAADVLMAFGTVRLSYAVPLNPSDGNGDTTLRDRTEELQISFGVDF